MDDILIFSNNKNDTSIFYDEAVFYAQEKLKLSLKPKISGLSKDGAPFLGFLVKPEGIYLHQKTKKRYKARIAEIEYKKKENIYTEAEASSRVTSVTAHLLLARSKNFRNNILNRRVFGD